MENTDRKRKTIFPVEEGKRRIKLTIAYNGASFHGWQRQLSARSVQQEIEEALGRIVKEPVTIHGSGRTDKGVHAFGQVAHFDTSNHSVPVEAFALAINHLLSHEIRILQSEQVDETFHARFSSREREYRYVIKRNRDFTPFDADRVCRVRSIPPVNLLNEYAKALVGVHDFTAFCSADDQSLSKVRDVYESKFVYDYFFVQQAEPCLYCEGERFHDASGQVDGWNDAPAGRNAAAFMEDERNPRIERPSNGLAYSSSRRAVSLQDNIWNMIR